MLSFRDGTVICRLNQSLRRGSRPPGQQIIVTERTPIPKNGVPQRDAHIGGLLGHFQKKKEKTVRMSAHQEKTQCFLIFFCMNVRWGFFMPVGGGADGQCVQRAVPNIFIASIKYYRC